MRPLISIAILAVTTACAVTPTQVLGLMDVHTDDQRQSSVEQAAGLLRNSGRPPAVRATAAKVIGRLRQPAEVGIEALRSALFEVSADPLVRAWSANALGELRSEASLSVLTESLRQPLDPLTFEQVLEGLAKHFVLLGRDPRRVVEVVEGMIYATGNQSKEPPPIYDVLGAKTRTVEVNIEVLARAVEAAGAGSAESRAALYQAQSELLAKLEESRAEIEAGPAVWQGRIAEAVRQSQRTLLVPEPRLSRLVLLGLGRIGGSPELGRPVAEVLAPEQKVLPRLFEANLSLSAAWALGRLELQSVALRRSVDRDFLAKSQSRPVLRLLADLGVREGEPDGLQRILRLGAAP